MVSRRRSTAWLVIASFGLAIATFVAGLGLAAIFDFPAKFLLTGLAVVHALEQRGGTGYEPAGDSGVILRMVASDIPVHGRL